jgi:hypothetical protein
MIHPTNPDAVWAPRADGAGFHWTVNPPADVVNEAAVFEPLPAASGATKTPRPRKPKGTPA